MKKILILCLSLFVGKISFAATCPGFAKKYNCGKAKYSNYLFKNLLLEFVEIKISTRSAEVTHHLYGDYEKNGKIYTGSHKETYNFLFGYQADLTNLWKVETNTFCTPNSLNSARVLYRSVDETAYRNVIYSINSAGNLEYVDKISSTFGMDANLFIECRKM